jgi:hypothetical protein
MAAETSDKLKNTAWVVSGAYAIGLISRRGWDSFNHFPSIADESLLDVDAIIFGFIFILQIAWSWAVVLGVHESDLLGRAKRTWARLHPDHSDRPPRYWLLLHMLFHIPFSFFLYLLIPWFGSIAISGGFNRHAYSMCFGWLLMCLGVFVAHHDSKRGVQANESDALERILAGVFGLDGDWGKGVMLLVFLGLVQGVVQYPSIAQRFGGGLPEQVMVFLKKDVPAKLPSQTEINGQVMDLVFRRGTKLGLKAERWKNDHVLVIDVDRIDRMYVGSRVRELDPAKLR